MSHLHGRRSHGIGIPVLEPVLAVDPSSPAKGQRAAILFRSLVGGNHLLHLFSSWRGGRLVPARKLDQQLVPSTEAGERCTPEKLDRALLQMLPFNPLCL